MRKQITKVQWLIEALSNLHDDPDLPWDHYPCIEWPFGKNTVSKYGTLSYNGRPTMVHRLVLILKYGDIAGWDSCHHCDNPPCFRPAHLFLGTAADNGRDMASKGRGNIGKHLPSVNVGTDHFNARLNDIIVLQARRDLANGISRKHIATMLGICQSGADKMLRGDTWKHVPMS